MHHILSRPTDCIDDEVISLKAVIPECQSAALFFLHNLFFFAIDQGI